MGLLPFNQLTVEAIGDDLSAAQFKAEADLDGGAGKFGADFYEVTVQAKTTSTMVHNIYLVLSNTSIAGKTPSVADIRSLHGDSSQVIPVLVSGVPGEKLTQIKTYSIRSGLTFRYVSLMMRQGFTDDIWCLLSFNHLTEPDLVEQYYPMVSLA